MPNIRSDLFRKNLLAWFDKLGRKGLPWQINKTPYRVWVSEIMLQQTQVNTVKDYYLRFLTRFPNVETLANAQEDEVLHLWTGLGYYSRARNLLRSAKLIMQNFQGAFPETLAELESLPGIGRSTAGAILAIAFLKPGVILDGNVKRVLARWQGILEWPGERKVSEKLWALAAELTPNERTGDYAQAIMDLGATVCVRKKPRCEECPLIKSCIAYEQNLTKDLPKLKPKKVIPIKQATLLVILHKQTFLLIKRPTVGVWGGLWSLPEVAGFATQEEVQSICQQRFGLKVKNIKAQEKFRHTFSHYHLDIAPVLIFVTHKSRKLLEDNQEIWYNPKQPKAIGLPGPVKKLIFKQDLKG